LDDLPEEARDIAGQVSDGFQNASFGNERLLDTLVKEVSDWMLGKSLSNGSVGRRRLAGVLDAEFEE
jgi:hypothetical protein